MEILIPGEDCKYQINFLRNPATKDTTVNIFRNGTFLVSATAEKSLEDAFCRNCGRKGALQKALSTTKKVTLYRPRGTKVHKRDVIEEPLVPRYHRIFIWESYRTATKKPRWDTMYIKLKRIGFFSVAGIERALTSKGKTFLLNAFGIGFTNSDSFTESSSLVYRQRLEEIIGKDTSLFKPLKENNKNMLELEQIMNTGLSTPQAFDDFEYSVIVDYMMKSIKNNNVNIIDVVKLAVKTSLDSRVKEYEKEKNAKGANGKSIKKATKEAPKEASKKAFVKAKKTVKAKKAKSTAK